MLVALAGILTGLWLIIQHQTTLTLIFGIVIAALCLAELVSPYVRR